MKIKIIKIIIVITAVTGWMVFGAGRAEAVIKRAGEIEVITEEPMFAEATVWYPGLKIEKSFQVKNRGRGAKTVQIETENEIDSKQLARILTVEIKDGTRGIFGVADSKTLRNFFDASVISLGEVFPGDSGKTFSAAVAMPAGAGNEYQGGRAKFDLRIGFAGESSSAVTVAGGGTIATGEGEGKEGLEGSEGGRQNPEGLEGEKQNPGESGRSGESGEGGESGGKEEGEKPGEVAGAGTEGINWGFWAMIGGLAVFGGLIGLVWWRRVR